MRVVLVGYSGYWGQKLDRVLCELGHTVTSRIDRHNIKQLSDSEADAAVIATPPDTHYSLAMQAMKFGMDVLVEKPMAMKASQAKQMHEFAIANNLVLSVDSTFCHSAAFDFLKILDEPLISYQSVRLAPRMPQAVITAGWDLIVHDLSILHALKAIKITGGIGAEDGSLAQAAIGLSSGGSAFIFASRCWPTKVREICLHFPSGTFFWTLDGLWKSSPSAMLDKLMAQDTEEPLSRLIKDFESRCLERRLEGRTDGLHGSEVVGCLERLFPSHSSIGVDRHRVGNGLFSSNAGQHLSV